MKIITSEELFREIKTKEEKFPYFYHPEFNFALNKIEQKKIVIIADDKHNSMVFKIWRNKFLNLLQPVYPPLTKEATRLNIDEERLFLNKFVSYVQTNKITHRITQPENFAIFHAKPDNTISAPFGTYFLDLKNTTEDELFKNLHSKHRNVIRNAEKNGVVIKYGKEQVEAFYTLFKQTMQRSNMYCQTLSYFKAFYNYLPNNIICGVAYHNEKPEGALFMPFTQFGSFYLYGASPQKTQINGSINLLHWHTIKLLKQKGIERYDFVGARLSDVSGTKLAGIQQFKERFGAQLEKGLFWKKDINSFSCNLFDNLVTLKLRLKNQKPPLDIIEQERRKQRVR